MDRETIHSEYLEPSKSSVLRVSGDVNWTTSRDLASEIDHCLEADHPVRLILDLNDVPRIDSSGVGALVEGLRHASRRRVKFMLCGVNPSLQRLLRRTCLDQVFEIRPSVQEALQNSQPS